MDESDLIMETFVLEVNSPGVDRPLITKADFQRNIGKAAKLILKNQKGTTDTVIGNLKSIEQESIILDIDGTAKEILLADIIKARLEISL